MIERVWLDWNAPCLPAAAAWLISRNAGRGDVCTLDHITCVLPGRRAGRVLLSELLKQCAARGLNPSIMVPPRTITPGAMIDILAPARVATATTEESVLAWTAALRAMNHDSIAPLVPKPPKDDDFQSWRDLAQTVQTLHVELSGCRLGFTEVAEQAERMEMMREGDRWRALAVVHDEYRRTLAACNLTDPQEAQWKALENTRDESHVVLIGVVELNTIQRRAISQMERVTSLIHAPESMSSMFDDLGCVVPSAWKDRCIGVSPDTITVADRPEDQGQAVMECLSELARTPRVTGDAHTASAITIGLADSNLDDMIAHAADWAGVPLHRAQGVPITRTGPYKLLAQIAAWLDRPCFANLAALLRHPHMETWLHAQLAPAIASKTVDAGVRNWITLLDDYFTSHLHENFRGVWLESAKRKRELKIVFDAVHVLLAPLEGRRERTLGEWVEPALAVLRDVYGSAGELDDTTEQSCIAIADALTAMQTIAEPLQPVCSSGVALRLALETASRTSLASPIRSDQIESLGWLELHLDPAPALILAGINDGALPQAVTSDAFLPDRLRDTLGLMCNADRYARDAYLLEAIANSRETLRLITGRRAADGEPLTPSRLLLACPAAELPSRILRLCTAEDAERWPLPLGAPRPAETCSFIIPRPPEGPIAIDRMSVTSFRTYLQCPYRFWLRHIQKLQSVGDDADELDAMAFGTLAHEVLNQFGRDESIRDSANTETIQQWLRAALDRISLAVFGRDALPAVRIQLERLKARLDGFAIKQAQLIAEGWRIHHCEYVLPERASLLFPNEEADQPPMRITGCIDRIDRHETSKTWRIIDYKTGDSPSTPFKAHHGSTKPKDEWIDLQLPLYRYLAAQTQLEGEIEVGYITLPKDADKVDFLRADWSEELFASAIDAARDVVRRIRAGEFWPPSALAAEFDDFATICQTLVLSSGGSDEAGDDGENGGPS
ncbi:MAG TPA: PD-(D/E)XK nuclease family protein [Phycisphaerales bacterium]|nr:PD-(D/E)XK nuclease family protein [Phycisphaerales bacterium]HRQ74956.1 PD-(D/E)XK nuclease family protein [Phycisphaerales bacterium]